MSGWSSGLAEDLKWELTILEVVHGFDLALLQATLQDQVIVPPTLESSSLRAPGTDLGHSLQHLRRWLKLLDLGITTAMVREALTETPDQDLAEALLKYFASKRSIADEDRDKTDFVATFLYKHPRVPGQWETRGYSLDGTAPVPPFEIALLEILGDSDLPDLSTAHDRLLDEFEHLREEIDQVRHFDELVEGNIILRARRLKETLGACFYHPRALAVVASYNAQFSKRFDELFRDATQHIKSFALRTQEQGGSIAARVHGDVTLRQLTEVHDEKILRKEYVRAQEQLRYVAKLKKAVDSRLQPKPAPTPFSGQNIQPRPHQEGGAFARAATASTQAGYPTLSRTTHDVNGASLHASSIVVGVSDAVVGPAGSPGARVSSSAEQTKLKSVEESIRAFVRAANPKLRQIVPMKFGNFALSPAEADAYCADHLDEKSFRADNARVLVRIVALIARICTETEELKQKQNSTYLWKQHAESIEVLMQWGRESAIEANRVMTTAQQRGLVEKVNVLNASLQRLQEKSTEAAALIRVLSARAPQ